MTDNEQFTQGERLKKFRESLGEKQTVFAKAIDIPQPYLAQMENGSRSISSNAIKNIAQSYKSLSLDWLLTGRGSMLLGMVSPMPSELLPVSGPTTRVLHLPNLTAWAGDVVNIDESLSEVEEWRIPRLGISGGTTLYSFAAQGNSMEPTIRAGDLLLCEPPTTNLNDIEHNAIYVVVFAGGVRVKRLRRKGNALELLSDNTNYQPYTIDEGAFSALRVRLRISDVRDFF
jgi:SOS-response transcriptional repressor LexA